MTAQWSKIIAVDCDGTIVNHEFPDIGVIKPNCINVLNKLKDNNHTIILWTCRMNSHYGNHLTEILVFLTANNVPYDYVNKNAKEISFNPTPKIYYDILIDDRALGMENMDWYDIEKHLIKLGYIS